jgi:hypothetical protein
MNDHGFADLDTSNETVNGHAAFRMICASRIFVPLRHWDFVKIKNPFDQTFRYLILEQQPVEMHLSKVRDTSRCRSAQKFYHTRNTAMSRISQQDARPRCAKTGSEPLDQVKSITVEHTGGITISERKLRADTLGE